MMHSQPSAPTLHLHRPHTPLLRTKRKHPPKKKSNNKKAASPRPQSPTTAMGGARISSARTSPTQKLDDLPEDASDAHRPNVVELLEYYGAFSYCTTALRPLETPYCAPFFEARIHQYTNVCPTHIMQGTIACICLRAGANTHNADAIPARHGTQQHTTVR